MDFNSACIDCLIRRQFDFINAEDISEADRRAFMEEILQIILSSPRHVAAAYLSAQFDLVRKKYLGATDRFAAIKETSNEAMLALYPRFQADIQNAPDPLALALRYARVGNFLDFACLKEEQINAQLDSVLASAPSSYLDEAEYAIFRKELKEAHNVLILGDNCGEAVFDKLLMETLKKEFPHLAISYVVRGKAIHNDITRKEATQLGLDRLATILDNGGNIAGTELDYCSPELRAAMHSADLIISKGQGNFESLYGCGLNIYYLLLCKCHRVCDALKLPMLFPLFANERRLPPPPIA